MKPFLERKLLCDAVLFVYIKDTHRNSRGFKWAPWFLAEIRLKEFVAFAMALGLLKRVRRIKK